MYFVYFIQQKSKAKNSPIKIGYSSDMTARLKSLQTGNPDKLNIIATVPCDTENEAREIEKILHKVADMKYKRLNGEWFMIYGSIKSMLETGYKVYGKTENLKEIVTGSRKVERSMVSIMSKKIKDLEERLSDLERELESYRLSDAVANF